MSTFTALNVDPEDDVQDFVDNTKEIQLEEAFKLYTDALKLHSQGPKYLVEAGKAYDALFQCEVFQQADTFQDLERDILGFAIEPEIVPPAEDVLLAPLDDDAPSNLQQILYLAYKNHGQFLLDCLKHHVKTGKNVDPPHVTQLAQQALDEFLKALARDESDTELWRRTGRIGKLLGSNAIYRYCLEAAVEVDDDPAYGEVDPANMEEGFAGMQLKELLAELGDEMALTHPIMGPYKKQKMPERLRKYIDPYPFLNKVTAKTGKGIEISGEEAPHTTAIAGQFSWDTVANLLRSMHPSDDINGSPLCVSLGSIIKLEVPTPDTEMAETAESQILQDASMLESPLAENGPLSAVSAPAGMEVLMTEEEPATTAREGAEEKADEDAAASHKRSLSMAGLPEPVDEESVAQKRSKRMTTRKRDTLNGPEIAAPADPLAENKLKYEEMGAGDIWLFQYVQGMLNRWDVDTLGESAPIKEVVDGDVKDIAFLEAKNVPIRDIGVLIRKWDNQMYDTFMAATAITRSGSGLRASGLSAFIEHSKTEAMKAQAEAPPMATDGLTEFVRVVNEKNMTIDEAGYTYFKAICPSYQQNLWPGELKTLNMQLLNLMDPSLQSQLEEEFLEARKISTDENKIHELEDLAQMLLELHLDLYVSITNISSKVDMGLRAREKDRLDRCFGLVEFIALSGSERMRLDFYWRNMWASFLYSSLHESATREHMIQCWNLAHQKMLAAKPSPQISLHNNMAMPEISAAAADRELSRLTTMDAFLNVFSDDLDHVTLIERLEPVIDDFEEKAAAASDGYTETPVRTLPPAVKSMRKFLENKGPSLRLFLWQRLRDAYEGIKYPTKVFSCYLRSLELIVDYIQSEKFKETAESTRHNELLGYLKTVDQFLVKALTLALNEQTAFDIIDDQHLKASMTAIASLCRILHAGSLLEDQVDSGLIPDNSAKIERNKNKHDRPQTTLKTFLFSASEMAMRSFTLLYTLVREGLKQKHQGTIETEVSDDLSQYLAVVHYPLGLRKRCDRSNKVFLKMMRIELIRMKFVNNWEDYLGQVLKDLYGLSLGDKAGVYELANHGCEHEAFDRRTAIQIMDYVLILAHRMQMKDLLKDDLRHTIEAMQRVIGPAKTNKNSAHNLRIINDYVKKPINPIKLHSSVKGMEYLDTLPVDMVPETSLASKGWYFLLGMIALTRFRSVKRVAPGAVDDLKLASTLFKTQLQFTPEHWEAWYHLGQCYDYELEEDVLWSSEKLNGDKYVRATLINEQRGAIHCYAMAVSMAYNYAPADFETVEKLSCLYHDFGTRMYASSRDPFAMEAFYVDGFERHMSGPGGMYTIMQYAEMSRFKIWLFASSLYKKALLDKPNNWLTHYMLGKCYWKMMTRYDQEPDQRAILYRPNVKTLIATLEKAVQHCPKPRDSRVEPILEPHYKIVVTLYKLTCNGMVSDFQTAADTIQRGRYALKKGDHIPVTDGSAWEKFINDHIRHLRSLDKSNWHHRFIIRAARMVTDKAGAHLSSEIALQGQKIMTTNGVFSKTMTVSVWKPEMERAGRHCVYMSRYVKYMIGLMWHIPDKAGLENLVKRVRKKGTEYFGFGDVWRECATAYCQVIRMVAQVMPGQDELCKSIPAEEWADTADALEAWADVKGNVEKHGGAMFEALKEACELKKLNGTLLRTMVIDDLVVDAYATLLWDIGTKLPRLPKAKPVPVVVQHPYDARGGVMSIDGVMSSIETGERLMPTVEIVENVRKVKHPAKREIMRRAEVLASKGGDTKVKLEKSESRKIEAKERGKSASGSREKTAEKAQEDEDQEMQDADQGDDDNEGDNGGDDEGHEEGDETGYGDETADMTRNTEHDDDHLHDHPHDHRSIELGDDEDEDDDDDDDTLELPKVLRRKLCRPPVSLPSERENGSDADDESDLSDVPDAEGDERREGELDEEAGDEDVAQQRKEKVKAVRRQSEAIREREEMRRREEVRDTDEEDEEESDGEEDNGSDVNEVRGANKEMCHDVIEEEEVEKKVKERGEVTLGEEEGQDDGE